VAAQRNPNVNNAIYTEGGSAVQDSTVLTVEPVDGVIKLTLTTGYTVNLGDFNNKRVEGSVSATFRSDLPINAAVEYLDERLYAVIKEEILIAQKLAPAKSYIQAITVD
jgi:hypothetical protein